MQNRNRSDYRIRPPLASDEPAWRELWAGYNAFYRASVPEEATAITFAKIVDGTSDIRAFVADTGNGLIGFAHFLFHATTWSPRPNCYLEDLFVDPKARGGGVAKALIEAVEAGARAENAQRLYWHTQEYNAAARSLYDTIVPRSSFIVYRKAL